MGPFIDGHPFRERNNKPGHHTNWGIKIPKRRKSWLFISRAADHAARRIEGAARKQRRRREKKGDCNHRLH